MTQTIERPALPEEVESDQLELGRRMWAQQLLNESLEELRIATFGRPCR
jgi:hypothetical protein